MQKVKVRKTEMSQETKMKGKKLNLRFKEFSQKKAMLENSMVARINHRQPDEKVNKSCFLQVKTN